MSTALDGPEQAGDGLGPEPAYYVLPGAAEKAERLLAARQE